MTLNGGMFNAPAEDSSGCSIAEMMKFIIEHDLLYFPPCQNCSGMKCKSINKEEQSLFGWT